MRKKYLYFVVSFHTMIRLYRLAIHKNITLLGCLLHLVTGGVLYKVHQEFIHAQRFLPFARRKGVMLIKRRSSLSVWFQIV